MVGVIRVRRSLTNRHGSLRPSAFGGGFCTDGYIKPAVSFHWSMQCNLDALRCGKSGDFVFTLYLCNGIFQWNVFDEMYLHTPFAAGIFTLQLCWLQMNSSTKRWDIRCPHKLISGSPPWSQKAACVFSRSFSCFLEV